MCATRSATASSTRSARRSRSADGGGGPVHITHFYHRATFPGTPGTCSAWSTPRGPRASTSRFDLYPYEWASTRLLIMLPTWIQAGGRGPAQGAPRRPGRAGADPRRAGGARSIVSPGRCLGRPAARLLRPTRARAVGGPDARRTTWPTPGSTRSTRICDLLLAEDLRVNEVAPGPHTAAMPTVPRPPDRR